MPTKTIVGSIEDFVFAKQSKPSAPKKWALYKGFIGGEKFQTFDEEYLKHIGEKKIFLYNEEEREFENEQGKTIKYTSRTLLPYKTAKSQDEDPYEEDEIPVVEEEEKASTSGTDVEAEFVNPEEKIMEALKGDDSWLQKIYKKLVEIVTILEK